ncbi:hypothetical protein FJT64_006187 [Amphibalanus amphitrite]|uniref:Uncharacterized protein n=1 Tax=Amphibalanus amphitrite TaxID=1232801 RepID=A0A6A4VRQ9_AMPAM|nr:hypothetical protein FJT64_006187 [Amphibalanus amphitrite]
MPNLGSSGCRNLDSVDPRIQNPEDVPLILLRLLGEEAAVVVEAPCVLSSRPIIQEGPSGGGSTFNVLVEGAMVTSATALDGALLLLGMVHL